LAVVLAQANNDPNSVDTLGVVTENILNNQEGFITTFGFVRNINTTGSLQGETWLDGDVLYLSPSIAGRLTKIKPEAPNHTVIVAFVVYSHANNGKIYIKVDNGYELNELHNVKINGVDNNHILKYDSSIGVWKNSDTISINSISAQTIFVNGLPVATTVDPVRTTLTGNGSLSTFSINGATNLVNPSALIVAIDGVLQEPVVDYSVNNGTITFTDPLASGAKAVVISPSNALVAGQIVPSDGSVTSAKIATGVTLTNPTINGASIVGPVNLTGQDDSTPDRVMSRVLGDARYTTRQSRTTLSAITSTTGSGALISGMNNFMIEANTTYRLTIQALITTSAGGSFEFIFGLTDAQIVGGEFQPGPGIQRSGGIIGGGYQYSNVNFSPLYATQNLTNAPTFGEYYFRTSNTAGTGNMFFSQRPAAVVGTTTILSGATLILEKIS
jgi:hypothetical protein